MMMLILYVLLLLLLLTLGLRLDWQLLASLGLSATSTSCNLAIKNFSLILNQLHQLLLSDRFIVQSLQEIIDVFLTPIVESLCHEIEFLPVKTVINVFKADLIYQIALIRSSFEILHLISL